MTTAATPPHHFTLFGVPVRVEPTFFLLPLLSLTTQTIPVALMWTALVFVSVLIHEFGHALAMKRVGFSPSVTLHLLGGFTRFPVAAHPTPRQSFFITLAGPGAGLALGLTALLARRLVSAPTPLVAKALEDAMWVNLGWSLINLLPILPWDGGLALDAGLEWLTGRRRDRLVAVSSLVFGAATIFVAVDTRMIILGYFGFVGLTQGFARWRLADVARAGELWERLNAGQDIEADVEAALRTLRDPAQRAQYAELLAWARLHKRDYARARLALRELGAFTPTVSIRARLAAAENDVDQVIALLSPEGAAQPAELPLLVSALIARERFDDVVARCERTPELADLAAARLFEAGAFTQALTLCTAERKRTGDGRFAYNEACCYCRLGRLDDAVTALQQAKTLGYAELAHLQTDEDLEPIRDRPEVRALLGS